MTYSLPLICVNSWLHWPKHSAIHYWMSLHWQVRLIESLIGFSNGRYNEGRMGMPSGLKISVITSLKTRLKKILLKLRDFSVLSLGSDYLQFTMVLILHLILAAPAGKGEAEGRTNDKLVLLEQCSSDRFLALGLFFTPHLAKYFQAHLSPLRTWRREEKF